MKIKSRAGKPVNQYDLTGRYLNTYESGLEAYHKTGVSAKDISHVCVGSRKRAGGFIWKHINNDYSLSDVVYCQCCGKVTDAEEMINISIKCLKKLKGNYNEN